MNKKGFTLIELLVVIVIIGILVAIALPNFIKIKDKAREAEVKQNLHAVQLSLERYAVDSPSSEYPLYLMGGDWADTAVVWQSWMDTQNMTIDMITNQERRDGWLAANQYMGDTLIMESYMPSYPKNPFVKSKSTTLVPHLLHIYDSAAGAAPFDRCVGGFSGDKMVEVFGPVNGPITDGVDQPFGDMCVHHTYNNPPYDENDILKTPVEGWTNPSGNRRLVGNFSYYARQGEGGLGWAWMNAVTDCSGYTLAGYGALRTAGQDVHNRNGDYKGRFRAGASSADPLGYEGIVTPPDINSQAGPTIESNNGGSDTLRDGVVVTLDSGVDKKTTRNSDQAEGEERT